MDDEAVSVNSYTNALALLNCATFMKTSYCKMQSNMIAPARNLHLSVW